MEPDIHFLKKALQKREEENLLRQLKHETQLVDLSSNDYLGFARNTKFNQDTYKEIEKTGFHLSGSTGSRLLTGNTRYAENLEEKIAAFHHAEAALLFNSGYTANLGLLYFLSALPSLIPSMMLAWQKESYIKVSSR